MITCLWCGTQFPEHEGVPILGQKPEDKLVQRIGKIAEHLKGRHLDKLQEVMTLQATLGGLAIMCNCRSDEALFNQKRLEAAASISRLLSRPLSDEDIEKRAAKFCQGGFAIQQQAAALLRQMRDYLEYRDILQPSAAQKQEG
jgi:hypothetical protein